jgi:hypothetical protein
LNTLFHTRYKGQTDFACNVAFEKGQELGWFEHGSTIIVFAPNGFTLADQILPGAQIKMGSPLMQLPAEPQSRQPADGTSDSQRSQSVGRVDDKQKNQSVELPQTRQAMRSANDDTPASAP